MPAAGVVIYFVEVSSSSPIPSLVHSPLSPFLPSIINTPKEHPLFQLFLRPQLVCVAALLLATILRAGGQASVALSANHLLAVGYLGESGQGRVVHTASQSKHKVKSRLLLDVVVRKGAAVLELLACEDEALLVRGDPLLILNFLLHVLNGVTRLYIEGDCFAREGLHEDLHI